MVFRASLSHAAFTIALIILLSNESILSLHLSANQHAKKDCKEVLSKNLECPSIGSYAVAGACDYFARCIQTENGVESEVDFCPDGHIYVVNRCIRSGNPDQCPQKLCGLKSTAITEQTTMTLFPETEATPKPTTPRVSSAKPKLTLTSRPFLNKLHLSRNTAMCNSVSEQLVPTMFLFLITIAYHLG